MEATANNNNNTAANDKVNNVMEFRPTRIPSTTTSTPINNPQVKLYEPPSVKREHANSSNNSNNNSGKHKHKDKKTRLEERFGNIYTPNDKSKTKQDKPNINIEQTKTERKKMNERDRKIQHRKLIRSKRSKELVEFNEKVASIMNESMNETFDLRITIQKLSQLIIEYNNKLVNPTEKANAHNLLNPFVMSELNTSFTQLSSVISNMNTFIEKYYNGMKDSYTSIN